jgi:hypothetical protein
MVFDEKTKGIFSQCGGGADQDPRRANHDKVIVTGPPMLIPARSPPTQSKKYPWTNETTS